MKESTAHSVAGIMQLIKEVKGQKNEYQDMIEDCISSWDSLSSLHWMYSVHGS